jgi:hypothetical protein
MFSLPFLILIQYIALLGSLNSKLVSMMMTEKRLTMVRINSKKLLIGLLMPLHQFWSVWENQFQAKSFKGLLARKYPS